MSELELKRFRQKVRSEIRQHVEKYREAPSLTLWASERENPRRVKHLRVGAAASAGEVRAKIVEGIRERGSHFAAVGRLLRYHEGGELHRTSVFGVVVVHAGGVEGWEVDVVAGRVGAWRETEMRPEVAGGEGESMADAWYFLVQAVRSASKTPGHEDDPDAK